ncbi:MAG: flagellar hook-length control protein FliK [Pseudomonadota bacterium]
MSGLDVIQHASGRNDPAVKPQAAGLAETSLTTTDATKSAFGKVLGDHREQRGNQDDTAQQSLPGTTGDTETPIADSSGGDNSESASGQPATALVPEYPVDRSTVTEPVPLIPLQAQDNSDPEGTTEQSTVPEQLPQMNAAMPQTSQASLDNAVEASQLQATNEGSTANATRLQPEEIMVAPPHGSAAVAAANTTTNNSLNGIIATRTAKTSDNTIAKTNAVESTATPAAQPLPTTYLVNSTQSDIVPQPQSVNLPAQKIPVSTGVIKSEVPVIATKDGVKQPEILPVASIPGADKRLSAAVLNSPTTPEAVTPVERTVTESGALLRQPASAEQVPMRTAVYNNAPQSVDNTVKMMLGRGVNTATVNLHPAELGAVRINLEMKPDQLQVQIIATQATTRDILEAALPRLREQLETEGFNAVSIDLGGGSLAHSHSDETGSNDSTGEPSIDNHNQPDVQSDASQYQPPMNSRNLVDLFA